jgi:UDP-N-acetylmuramyl pentapeptide phosphotransferase/UDP-N-acetylglucosamine-1-phosphate transferase
MSWSAGVLILLSFLLSFVVVYFSIPSIVTVSQLKGLYDRPGHRKCHSHDIPNLGGISIFAGIVMSAALFINSANTNEFLLFIAGMTVLFFIGLKDDILVIDPNKKLWGEVIAILILVLLGDVRFTNLHGFMGVYELNEYAGIGLSVFVMVVIVNAFNLIDGIDGLASAIGIIISVTFGIWFYIVGYSHYAILSAAVAGSLIAFFRYNVFGGTNKIFMGDTGSLIIGFAIALLVVRFNEINAVYQGAYSFRSAPAVSFGILIIPLFDTMRVFLIRILKGHSPFRADKNHLHHRLLLLGFTHIQTTTIIGLVNVIFILAVIAFQSVGIVSLMLINLSMAIILIIITEVSIRIQYRRGQISTINRYNHSTAKTA